MDRPSAPKLLPVWLTRGSSSHNFVNFGQTSSGIGDSGWDVPLAASCLPNKVVSTCSVERDDAAHGMEGGWQQEQRKKGKESLSSWQP